MPRRTAVLPPVRVSPAEKALIEENAEACGLNVSEYLRGLGLSGRIPPAEQEPPPAPDDREQRIREHMRTMPRVNAEILVRREEAAARARAALAR